MFLNNNQTQLPQDKRIMEIDWPWLRNFFGRKRCPLQTTKLVAWVLKCFDDSKIRSLVIYKLISPIVKMVGIETSCISNSCRIFFIVNLQKPFIKFSELNSPISSIFSPKTNQLNRDMLSLSRIARTTPHLELFHQSWSMLNTCQRRIFGKFSLYKSIFWLSWGI